MDGLWSSDEKRQAYRDLYDSLNQKVEAFQAIAPKLSKAERDSMEQEISQGIKEVEALIHLERKQNKTLPYDIIKASYDLPFELRQYQQNTVNELADSVRAGYYLDIGTGKTYTSISACLYKKAVGAIARTYCIMPPILITNWSRNLAKIPGVTHTCYRGTPAKRKTLNLDVDFILMSWDIFKRDWEELLIHCAGTTVALLCDEAQALKNIASGNYKKVRDFIQFGDHHLLLLTGTPLSSPMDAYAYIKLITPEIYQNRLQFENTHVAEVDFFHKPTKWRNLDLLNSNLARGAVRLLKEDVVKELPEVTITELNYDLSSKHKALYDELATKQLKVLEDGTKIDITHVSALLHALAQVPANAEHFSGGSVESTLYELIDEIMDELGDGKLVIFTKYVMTNRRIQERCAKYNPVALYGEISAAQQQENLDRFVNDPACRIVQLQYASGGAGIDNLQHVCSDVLFVELPPTSSTFHQCVGRVHRVGQSKPVHVRIALAEGTLQNYLWQVVQDKDTLINLCIRGYKGIKDMVMGHAGAPA